jgi:hypothetical protein
MLHGNEDSRDPPHGLANLKYLLTIPFSALFSSIQPVIAAVSGILG